MSRKFIRLTFFVLLLSGLVLGFAIRDGVLASPLAGDPSAKIEGALQVQFVNEGSADFIITFNENADLSAAYSMDWDARGHFVYDTLTATAQRVQANAKSALDNLGLTYKTFIADNSLYVFGGNAQAANTVAALPEVSYIRATRVYQVDPAIDAPNAVLTSHSAAELLANHASFNFAPDAETDWGITDTKADQFWSTFGVEGSGIVVANIDTGVDYTHEALNASYKCVNDPSNPECWLNPGTQECTGVDGGPCDTIYSGIYHGTHTMGTMVASNDPALPYTVGMAPDAQWIACMGCPSGSCPDFDLFSCADWVVAPNGNPDARPNVVNNSWGGYGGNDWYLDKVNSWRAAGIFPAFSAGNSGSCSSLGSPGDYQESFGSASHQVSRAISGFSSKGPSTFGHDPYTKPNISSPGENINSTQPNNGWTVISGTSMASPHTAGAVALLWSCNPSLVGQIDQTFQILQDNADAPPPGECGAPPDGEGNNTFGYGYLDVLSAGYLWCGDLGNIDGHVKDAVTQAAIAGASVKAVGELGGGPSDQTDGAGYYNMATIVGLYDVTASDPHYVADTVTGVEVVSGTTTTQDFFLTPRGWVYGTVTDYDNGTPIVGATVSADDGQSTLTDDAGNYQIYLDPGDHTITAVIADYAEESAVVSVVSGAGVQQDFALQAAVVFVPSPIDVDVPLGDVFSVPATITNRMPDPYNFEFKEKAGTYQPEEKISIPAFTGEIEKDTAPASTGMAPLGAKPAGNSPAAQAPLLAGPSAYMADINTSFAYYFMPDVEVPGNWNMISSLSGTNFYAGDFINGDFSTEYAIDQNTVSLYAINTATGERTLIGPSTPGAGEIWTGMTGAVDGTMYASANANCTNSTLYTIDLSTGAATPIGPVTNAPCLIDIAINSDGDMYGVDIINDVLVKIDPATGAGEVIGSVGINANWAQGMDFDQDTGILYWASYDMSYQSTLRIIDTTTGNSISLGNFPGGGEIDAFATTTGGPSDVPWLAEVPVSGTVPADSELPVTINFDASPTAGVYQPGTYNATLKLDGVPKLDIPVSMYVVAPPTWGRIDGTVTSEGYCDQNPAVLEGATVAVDGAITATLTTDESGYYATWLPEGTYTLNVTADDHTSATGEVVVVAQGNSTTDFSVRWTKPCLTVDPTSMETTLGLGETSTLPLSLINNGAGALTWQVTGTNRGYQPLVQGDILVVAYDSMAADSMEIALDTLGQTYVEVDSFTFEAMTVDQLLEYSMVFYAGIPLSNSQNLLMAYLDAGGRLYVSDNDLGWSQGTTNFYTTYLQATYLEDHGGDFATGEDLMTGLDLDLTTDPYPDGFTVGAEGVEIFVWDQSGHAGGDAVARGDYKAIYTAFDFQFASNAAARAELVSRIVTYLGVGELTWLTETPANGTVPADTTGSVDINFNAGAVTQPGTYLAALRLKSDDPFNDIVEVPVTMTVSAPADWGKLVGTVTSQGYCDSNPAPLSKAEVCIEGGLCLETANDGTYAIWLQQGIYNVNVTADGHTSGSDTVEVYGNGQISALDFSLRVMQPCMSQTPATIETTLDMGQVETHQLTLINTGAAASSFEVSDKETGYTPVTGAHEIKPLDGANSKDAQSFQVVATPPSHMAEADVLLIQDSLAWGSPAITTILTDNGMAYDLINSSQIASWDFSPYRMILIPSAQGPSYYNAFNNNLAKFEQFVDDGGVMLMSVANFGEAMSIPFGGTNPQNFQDYNYIVDTEHPIFAGVPNPYYGNSASHNIISGLLENDVVLVTAGSNPGGDPVMIERYAGSGLLVVGGQTFEYGWMYGQGAGTILTNMIPWYYNNFHGGADALWMTEEPVSGTVPADGGTQLIDVTFDAGQVTQPGVYAGKVKTQTDDPVNTSLSVVVTMTVTAPADWGKLSGTVTGLGYCDLDPAPLSGAQVSIAGGLTMETDDSGNYLVWLQAGNYDVTVTADGHEVATENVTILPEGAVTDQDFNLRWLQPCMSEAPEMLEVTLDLGQSATLPITLTNDGAAVSAFEVSDQDTGYVPLKLAQKSKTLSGAPFIPEGSSTGAAIQPFLPRLNQNPILELTTTDSSQSVEKALNELGYAYDLMMVPPFTGIDFSPYDIVILAMDGGSIEANDIQILRENVLDQGKQLIFVGGTCWAGFAQGVNTYLVQNDTGNYCWQVTSSPQWTITDSSSPLATGLPDSYNFMNTAAGFYTIRVNDPDIDQVAVNGENHPAFFQKLTYGNFIWFINSAYGSYWTNPDDFAFLKQVILNSIEAAGGDAAWLSEEPITGTVGTDGSTQLINATFDAGVVTQPGVYNAEIRIKTDDPVTKKFVIPAVMNVNGPEDWGRIEGVVNGLGYCDATPAPIKDATVTIGGLVLKTDTVGHYSTWLAMGDYTVNVAAEGHLGTTADVTINPQELTTQDFGLRLITPCVSTNPQALTATVVQGHQLMTTLHLVNDGAGATAFQIREAPSTMTAESRPVVTSGTRSVTIGDNLYGTRTGSAKSGTSKPVVAPKGINETTITESVSQEIMFGNSVSCNMGGLHADTHYLRVFDLPAFDIDADFAVTSVDIGIESAAAGMGGSQPAVLNIYTLEGDLIWANMTLIASADIDVANQELTVINMPIEGVVPAGSLMVVDFFTPNGQAVGNSIFVGSNNLGQTAPTYIAATDCGNTEPLETGDIGFPGMHLVMNVTGNVGSQDIPWLMEEPLTGTLKADSIFDINVSFDSMTYTLGTYTGWLKIKTSDSGNPTIQVPVTMDVVTTRIVYLPIVNTP